MIIGRRSGFGGGWFCSIGSPSTTTYHAEQVQGDVALNFSRGHIKAFAGVSPATMTTIPPGRQPARLFITRWKGL